MIKLIIKHEGQVIEGAIPSGWPELKVKHFIGLNSKLSEIELLSLLSDLDLSMLENTETDLSPFTEKLTALFSEVPPDLKKLKRQKIKMLDKEIIFPSSINFSRYGQKSMVKNLIQSNDHLEAIVPEVFAIYAQPIIDGKFDSTRIDAIKNEVNELPIMQVFPHVFFFFKKLKELKLLLLIK